MIACLYGPQRAHVPPLLVPFRGTAVTATSATVITTKPAKRKTLPDGVELTLSELQEMASRQQQQIESQQQMLVAKEQRVKFLKAQEQRQQELSAENERLRRLRDRVDAQEAKLHKLRSLRGHVDQQKINNSSLTSELESIRSLFNAKEKELSVAVAKVDQLTNQLEELRRGRIIHNGGNGGGGGGGQGVVNGGGGRTSNFPATIELEKLRQELLYRNKLNEQQQTKLVEQREMLHQRTEEMSRIDRRIAELQQRLHRKRLLNQQLASQINAKQQLGLSNRGGPQMPPAPPPSTVSTSTKGHHHHHHGSQQSQQQLRSAAIVSNGSLVQSGGGVGQFNNVAAVEPYQHLAPNDESHQRLPHDDLHATLLSSGGGGIKEELSEFHPNKNDPKYQTLPYNTKFSSTSSSAAASTAKYGAKNAGVPPAVDINSKEAKKNGAVVNDIGKPDGKVQQQLAPLSPASSQKIQLPVQQSQQQSPHKALPVGLSPQTVHSIPTYAPAKAHATPVSQSGGNQPPTAAIVKGDNASAAAAGSQVMRQYGSGYTGAANSITRVQYVDGGGGSGSGGGGTKLIAPPYIPPPASTMQKVQQAANSGRSNAPTAQDKPTSAVQPSTVHQVVKAPVVQSISTSQSLPNRPFVTTAYQSASTKSRVLPTVYGTAADHHQDATNQLVVSSTSLTTATATTTHHQQQQQQQQQQPMRGVPSESNNGVSSTECVEATSENVPRPALPPKPPPVPGKPTPPPRQSHGAMVERSKSVASAGLESTTEAAADPAALTVLSNQQPINGHRYASKTVIANTYTRKVNNGVLDQYLKSVNQLYGKGGQESAAQGEGAELVNVDQTDQQAEPNDQSPALKRPSTELPIKAKPLTIKKQTGVEPPKLKGASVAATSLPSTAGGAARLKGQPQPQQQSADVQQVRQAPSNSTSGLGVNRRIEIPPAFLFPPEVGGGGEQNPTDEVDRSATTVDVTSVDQDVAIQQTIDAENESIVSGKRKQVVVEGGRQDNNANDDDSIATATIEDGGRGGDEFIVEGQNEIERPGPVGGSLEENNNNTNNNKYIETTISTNKDDVDQLIDDVNEVVLDNELKVVTHRTNKKGNLKSKNSSTKTSRRVSFDPLALLLDAALEGELELVKKTAKEVPNPSAANDEGITALHNAICAGHYEIVQFLVEFGCDVNAQDSDGWTPLHCAASCNNLPMVNFLVEHGACIFATTLSDHETAAEKCEEDEEGFDGCTEYLYSIQEKLGILNGGVVYALYDYEAQSSDELAFRDGDVIVVLRKGDEFEREWWWSKVRDREGYIPRNLLGLHPRVTPIGTD